MVANNMSVTQTEALVDFLEEHKELALGRCSRTKEGRSLSKRLWQECAEVLNSVSSDCVQKTGEQWRMFYNEYKHRLLKKIKKDKSETGGGSIPKINLTPLQERLYTILGRDVGEPLPGVRHNPFIPIQNEGSSATASYHDGVNVVTYEVLQNLEDSPGFVPMEVEDPLVSSLRECEPAAQSLASREPSLQLTEGQQTEPAASQTEPAASQNVQHPNSLLHGDVVVGVNKLLAKIDDQDAALRSATETLASIENVSAQATNRLAAAIEALAARLNEPIRIVLEDSRTSQMVHHRGKRTRIIYSDSE
ncbi:unnamed protein product [Spodoptera littoralis]|uniref:Regulatory protein zeste n=1 Tax=Spodoptera littoralis TaxID=7109 RepID=A0A9P0ICZ5_SPOLI|nr:unnamed protein product [Spodoptera littoralis]CAH1645623.1 unnamed protein product [Spodoptera littoralis]